MGKFSRPKSVFWVIVLGVLGAATLGIAEPSYAELSVLLRNGYRLRGTGQSIAGLDKTAVIAAATGDDFQTYPILVIDDGLKRSFVHARGMLRETSEVADLLRRLTFWQSVARGSNEIAAVGIQTTATPFNSDGRRVVTTLTGSGPIEVLQGITEINARYEQAQGLQTKVPYNWDTRISTDAIPAETFKAFFGKQIDSQDYDRRLDVLNFYIEAERFSEARETLQDLIRDYPESAEFEAQFKSLTQREARQILDEATARRNAGQHRLALAMLQHFVNVDGLSRIIRLEAEDQIRAIEQQIATAKNLIDLLRTQVGQLPPEQSKGLSDFVDIIESEMSFDTFTRLSDYQRLSTEASIPLENRVALAIGGWLLGAGSGLQNLAVARSLIEVRELVSGYLAESDPLSREQILKQLKELEGARPEYISRLLALIPPPLPLPEEEVADPNADNQQPVSTPGTFELSIETTMGPTTYMIQLPPEYNPLRKYPTLLALHPIGAFPLGEIEFWAGLYDPNLGLRTGQASRQGYIVVAPKWNRDTQRTYEFTQVEHQRVLMALRDAMRRVSIDSDRIYIAGHLDGATAAWDIAVAHPDLWAGLICIGGTGDRYIKYYNENAKNLPIYYVSGEMGATSSLMINGSVLNDYMKPNYDAIVTLYRGRGDELYLEDVTNIFQWMRLTSHRRGPPPKEIDAVTMRDGDQFFWWLELPQLMDNIAVHPILFDTTDGKRAVQIRAAITTDNLIRINQTPAPLNRVLLSPEMGLDLSKTVTVRSGSRSESFDFDNSIAFMLEDARQRADRQHVFWAEVIVR